MRLGSLVELPILGLANAPIVETKILELAMSLLDFSPRIPLGTFSILLHTRWTLLMLLLTLIIKAIPSLSLFHNLKFIKSGLKVWKAFGKGYFEMHASLMCMHIVIKWYFSYLTPVWMIYKCLKSKISYILYSLWYGTAEDGSKQYVWQNKQTVFINNFIIPFGFSLFWHVWDICFQLLKILFWLRITDAKSAYGPYC